MKRILSYGGGVNSTAILALIKLGKVEMPDRIIFCDTGAERNTTYCYMKYIKKIFPMIETVMNIRNIKRGKNAGKKITNLLDYCKLYKIIPCRQFRWCTTDWKILPYQKACPEKHIKILGIDYGEQKRVKDRTCEYPLIDLKLDRKDCIEIIKKTGLNVPEKSGCFICPFMKKSELNNLRKYRKDEFNLLVKLEATANKRNSKIFFKGDSLIPAYCNDKQKELNI